MITLFLSSNFGDWKAPEGSIVFPEAGKAPAEIFAFAKEMIERSLKEDVAIVTYSELILLRVQRKTLESRLGIVDKFHLKYLRVENGVVSEVEYKDVHRNDLFAEDYFETVEIEMLTTLICDSEEAFRDHKKG